MKFQDLVAPIQTSAHVMVVLFTAGNHEAKRWSGL